MEKPVVFKVSGQQVVGMLHLPERRKGRAPAVVFFHGFTGTKVESHRIFVKMARALAKAGIVALRFDFRGCGDSEGEFSTLTTVGQLKDARAALAYVRKLPAVDPKKVGVLGLSMGGLIAALLLAEDPKIAVATLWCPVAHLDRLVKSRMIPAARRMLKQMGIVDDGGNAVGKTFIENAGKFQPCEAIRTTRAPVLLIHGKKDQTVPFTDSNDYEKALRKAGKPVVKHLVAGADHTFNTLPWETQVIALTLEWFRCNLAS